MNAVADATGSFAVSSDGIRIAYEVTRTGPMVVLLHGGGQSRRVWHELGFVDRLRDSFTVVTMDIRGSGESDKPTNVEAYGIKHHQDDVLSVADTVGQERFSVWGYSYGGNIARYLPGRSDRVTKLVIMGIPFGAADEPAPFRQFILGLQTKWTPVVEADRAGTLDAHALSTQDRAVWKTGTIPLTLASLGAILNWPRIEPDDLRCPTLWLVGTANEGAMPSVDKYRHRLTSTKVSLHLMPGLTHEGELKRIDDVLPPMREFTLGLPGSK
jgi:pimeloyl-ACP methyl ester carboxylesterase